MKKGISLIVLVITIIVMIILAVSVVISLNNTGIIERANSAVDLTNEKQVQDLAALIWAETYLDEDRTDTIEKVVTDKLALQGVTTTDWNIEVSNTGVKVTSKNANTISELGAMITADDYGKTVDYTVTVNDIEYKKWQIFYHNEDYVYLISEESVDNINFKEGVKVSDLTLEEKELYEIFRPGDMPRFELIDKASLTPAYGCRGVALLIRKYANFANKAEYGTNVVGAIGGPTIELFVSGWNAKKYEPKIYLTTATYGYKINDTAALSNLPVDGLYITESYYWVASPHAFTASYAIIAGNNGWITTGSFNDSYDVRPVVCLKSSTPAKVGTTTNFSLVK